MIDLGQAQAAAQMCLRQYDALPQRGAKPILRTDGRREWTILSALLLSLPSAEPDAVEPSQPRERFHPIALATGVKCAPFDRLSANGDILHDGHAEVIVRRAARAWLLRRLRDEVIQGGSQSLDGLPPIFELLDEEQRPRRRWRLRHGVHLVWFISTLPCGDASTKHLMAMRNERSKLASGEQKHNEEVTSVEVVTAVVRGRSNETVLSTLRTKPGRVDSLPAVSMSCSDKLASYLALGIQGSLMSELVEPIIPSVFIIGFPTTSSRPEEEAREVERQCRRALWDRIEPFLSSLSNERQSMQGPEIIAVPNLNFSHSKEVVERAVRAEMLPDQAWDEVEPVPAAGSIAWTRLDASKGRVENHLGGLKMGASAIRRKGQEHVPFHPSKRSALCKLNWYRDVLKTRSELAVGGNDARTTRLTYYEAKHDASRLEVWKYRQRKLWLRGWAPAPSCGPDGAGQEWTEGEVERRRRRDEERRRVQAFCQAATGVCNETVARPAKEREEVAVDTHAPFYGWLVTGAHGESFDAEGTLASPVAQSDPSGT